MNNEKQYISDTVNQFFIENEINQSEPPSTSLNKSQGITKVEIISEPPNQTTEDIELTECYDYNNYQNDQYSVAQRVLNVCQGNTPCIGKYVYFPELNISYFIGADINYNPKLLYNGQAFATIQYQNSEFVVYQNGYRRGIVTGNPHEQIWRFIPDNMPIAQPQNQQAQMHSSANTPSNNIILENVPADKVTETYDFINNFSPNAPTNIYVNFADSPSQKKEENSSDSQDIIDIPTT